MKDKPTPDQIDKLPKWAQEHIENLDRRAVIAERTLREFYDNSTPSEFYTWDWDAEQNKTVQRFIQTHKMTIHRGTLRVEVLLRQDDPGVDITWSDESRLCNQVPLITEGLNHVRVMLKKDLR